MPQNFSNTTNTILRSAPYHDDFYEIADTNTGELRGDAFDFHRVLFRPGIGVQSRELTQLQTLLQQQVERMGGTQFRNGDRVVGAQLTIDTSAVSGMVVDTVVLPQFFDRDTNEGKRIYQSDATTTRAKVTQYVAVDDQEFTSENAVLANNYLVFQYDGASTFTPGSVVVDTLTPAISGTFKSNTAQNFDVFSPASTISISEGIMFVSGLFVRVRPQTITLDPLSNSPSFRVGVLVEEQILDELDDTVGETLLDPANNNAVGAHRFRVRLTLAKKLLTDRTDSNFIEIARVVNGAVQYTRVSTKFVRPDELADTLARRTYDESGDYVVRNFAPVVVGNPDDTLNETFRLSIGSGKAYVRGYEIETLDTTYLPLRKGLDTESVTNRSIPLTVGNYLFVSRVSANVSASFFANTGTVDLHCVHGGSLNTANSALYTQSKIGTAKVRMIETYEVPPQTLIGGVSNSVFANNSVYKLFYYDADFSGVSATGNVVSATTANTAVTLRLNRVSGGNYAAALPYVNNAIDGATIVLGGTNSPVSGAFTVETYLTDAGGDANVVSILLRESLAGLPNGNTTYQLIFQMRDVDAFANFNGSIGTLAAPFTSNLSFQADVTTYSKDDGFLDGWTRTEATTDNALVYQLPEAFIKANTMNTGAAQFSTWVPSNTNGSPNLSSAANAAFTITFPTGGGKFALPTGTLSASSARRYFTFFDVTGDQYGRGQMIQFADAAYANTTTRCITSVSVSGTPSGGYTLSATYCHGAGSTSTTRTLQAFARVDAIGYPIRTKTLIVGNTTNALANTNGALLAGQVEYTSPNVAVGYAYSLKTPDVVTLKKVLYHANGSATFTDGELSTATDVTHFFTLDTGQRDNTYEYGRAIVKAGASSVIAPTGRLLFIFDWFQHSGIGFAAVDSYLYANSAPYVYDNIPSYTSTRFNRTISLRDVLDFRPVRSNYDFQNTAMVMVSGNTTSNVAYTDAKAGSSTFAQAYLIPVSDDVWLGSYAYYLGRIDKVSLHTDGLFHVTEGQPSPNPVPPAEDIHGLLMYQLSIPPYTVENANGVPTTVRLQTFDHKRYTMRDVAKVEDRVAHLEYYTSLNQLERATRDQSVPDPTNAALQRFKNGFVVDAFTGMETSDWSNPDFTASIDLSRHTLHPAYHPTMFGFYAEGPSSNTTSSNVTRVGDMVVPSYSVEPLVAQTLASSTVSVNPFNIKGFYGTLTLSPSIDNWKSTTEAPSQVIDVGGPTLAAADSSFTVWNEWQTNWFGITAVVPQRETTYSVPPGWTPEDHAWRSQLQIDTSWNDVETTAQQTRTGTQFNFVSSAVTQSIGNRVIDTSIIPSLRARDVVFSATGVKPGAYLYPFFDKQSVAPYVQAANLLKLYPVDMTAVGTPAGLAENAFWAWGSLWNNIGIGSTIYVKKPLTGTVATSDSSTTLSGEANTFFDFELVAGQLLRVEKGATVFDTTVASVANSTSATLSAVAAASLTGATVSTLTPVTIADIARRTVGGNVEFTLAVVRANRPHDNDEVKPYTILPGALRPEKLVKDTGTSTNTATVLLTLATGVSQTLASVNVKSAVIRSGVVRSVNPSAKQLRLDLDVTDSLLVPGTVVYIAGGPGAGQTATVNTYTSSTQTVTLNETLAGVIAGESIYSIGLLRAEGYASDSTVTSGYAGTCAGALHLQEGQFATGERIFRLTDDASDIVANATTTAEAKFVATGLAVTEQSVSVSSRYIDVNRSSATDARTVRNTLITDARQDLTYIDPLAETFLVSSQDHPNGIMLSSVDVLFASKPSTEVPVFVEIRTTATGYPTTTIVPCVAQDNKAVAFKYPDGVAVVAPTDTTTAFSDSSKYTRFTFPSLVHLLPGEYALVIRSDSDEYQVYTAVQGAFPLGATSTQSPLERISKQPYAGVLFKSQNGSTWTASQDEDLTFRLNRAVWTAPTTGTVILRAQNPDTNVEIDTLTLYPKAVHFGNVTAAGYSVSIKTTGANVATTYAMFPEREYALDARSTIQGRDNGLLPDGAQANTSFKRSGGTANTIDIVATLTTTSTDVAPYIDMKQFGAVGVANLIDDMSLDAAQISILDRGSYTSNVRTGTVDTTAASPAVIGTGTSFTSTLVLGEDVVIGDNLVVQVLSVANDTYFTATSNLSETRAANTYATFDHLALTFSTSDVGTTPAVNVAMNYAVLSAASSTANTGIVTSVVVGDGGSGYVSNPTVTVSGNAAMGVTGELSPVGGTANTRYITKSVTLADGFDARDLRVWFDGFRPVGTNFYVYYKVMAGDDTSSRFVDQPWRLMVQETEDSTLSNAPNQFREFAFKTLHDRAFDQSTDTTDKFKVFAVKIVLASNDTTIVPLVRNLRVIALDQ